MEVGGSKRIGGIEKNKTGRGKKRRRTKKGEKKNRIDSGKEGKKAGEERAKNTGKGIIKRAKSRLPKKDEEKQKKGSEE